MHLSRLDEATRPGLGQRQYRSASRTLSPEPGRDGEGRIASSTKLWGQQALQFGPNSRALYSDALSRSAPA